VTTVAIMQPTYLPWCGYFDLMDQVDLFVYLDAVQFDRRSWQQRNRVKSRDGALWLTVPVQSKGKRDQLICDVELDATSDWATKHIKTIGQCYARASHYTDRVEPIVEVLGAGFERLADLNVALIDALCSMLGVQTETVRSTALAPSGGKGELLVAICKELGATRYVSPPGSRDYLDEHNPFPAAGIDLCYQAYEHPVYDQLFGEFVSHLSVVDLLMNEDNPGDALRSGRADVETTRVQQEVK